MTREQKLYAMNGALLIGVADKLGVKVACNKTRNQLKEAKANVIKRILEAEAALEEKEETVESIEEIVDQDSLEDQERDERELQSDDNEETEEPAEEPKEKKSRGAKGKQIEFDGKSMNLNEWAKKLGMTRQTLYARLYIQNWDVEKAFTTPGRKAK